MKGFVTVIILFFLTGTATAQSPEIEFALKLSLKGDHAGAREALLDLLKKEPANLRAKLELSREHYYLKEWEPCFRLCRELLDQKKDTAIRRQTYVVYGTCLDASGDPKAAVKVFKKGRDEFPSYYLIPFNMGVTYYSMGKKENAAEALYASARLNPHHPGSAFYLAVIMDEQKNRIATLLALMRFLILEQEGSRALAGVELLVRKMEGNVSKGDNNQMNITVEPGSMDKKAENNFSTVDLFLSLSVATLYGKDTQHTPAEKLAKEIQALCTALAANAEGQKGFFWEFYAPFFIAMEKNGHAETLAYVLLSYYTDPGEDISAWVTEHRTKADAFFEWEKNYFWPQ
ncbi:MAG: hypothetical protein IT233_13870 [Bacteroidia bacterium]|nr:hypothetical protein [Bacteroidia bacterium]